MLGVFSSIEPAVFADWKRLFEEKHLSLRPFFEGTSDETR
jgi:hypothetical protein